MNITQSRILVALAVAAVLSSVTPVGAQNVTVRVRGFSANVIVPQSRSLSVDPKRRVVVTGVKVGVVILEQAATTTLDISLRNTTRRRLEAELLVPVPEGAAVRGFSFEGAGKEPSATLLPKDEAVINPELST